MQLVCGDLFFALGVLLFRVIPLCTCCTKIFEGLGLPTPQCTEAFWLIVYHEMGLTGQVQLGTVSMDPDRLKVIIDVFWRQVSRKESVMVYLQQVP